MNLKEKCSVDGCNSMQTGSKGFCLKHYTQMARHGKIKEKILICTVEGCNKTHKAKGYCWRHLKQIEKYGEIRGNVSKTMFDPNKFEIDTKNKIVYIIFNDLLGNELKEKAIIDLEDFDRVKNHKWYLSNLGYVRTKTKIDVALHHFVLNVVPKKGKYIDHKNMNKLDNRKNNLRFCTKGENSANSKLRIDNKTGFKGIFEYKPNKWEARIGKKHIGVFSSPREAAIMYDKKLVEKYGEFARTNQMEGRI